MSKLTSYHHLVVDILSDEKENYAHSTPLETLPLNMIKTLNLSAESTKAAPGSERDKKNYRLLRSSQIRLPVNLASIFFPDKIIPNQDKEAFTVEGHTVAETGTSYYEEPDSPRRLPPLQPAPFLRDMTNKSPANSFPPEKAGRLNDLDEPSVKNRENLGHLPRRIYQKLYPGRTRMQLHIKRTTQSTQAARAL